jgi:bacteriorhodopsin
MLHAVMHVCFGIWHETDSPCTLYLSTGNMALWLRYAEWLLTCPVILIHLSNLTGMKNDYNKRTMALLVSDVGCIVWGITSALAGNRTVKVDGEWVRACHKCGCTLYVRVKCWVLLLLV